MRHLRRLAPANPFVWALAFAYLLFVANAARTSHAYGRDFYDVQLAAHNLLAHGDPYRRVPGQNPFAYPPSAALLLLPIAGLGAHDARLAGLLLVLVALIVLAIVSARIAQAPALGTFSGALLAVLAVAVPSSIALLLGNMSAVVAAMLAVTLLLGMRGRWIAGGVVFGIAVALKPLVVPAALIFVLPRRWRGLAAAAAAVLLLNLLAAPLLHDPTAFITNRLPQLARGELMPRYANGSVRVVLEGLGAPTWSIVAARVAVVAAGIAICALVWRSAEPVRSVVLAAVPVLTIALAGGTDENHFVLVAVPMLTVLATRFAALPAVICGVGVAVAAFPGALLGGGREHGGRQVAAGQVLILAAVLIQQLRADARIRAPARN